MSVPRCAHFIWFGDQFPWVNVLAVRSAALRGGFDAVTLHHDQDLTETPYYETLVETPGVTLRRLEVDALLERCAPLTSTLRTTYRQLQTPATRSDLVRFALLYSEGGVYLDIDTVTIGSFAPLCAAAPAFCGEERIVYPGWVRRSRNPFIRAGALVRGELRNLLRSTPRGWMVFRKIERLYWLAANPAVVASEARSLFISDLIQAMDDIPIDQQHHPNVIGPHLLQTMVQRHRGREIQVHAPEVFFPLPPVISEHWFRECRHVRLSEVIGAETLLVHWYASVRTKHIAPLINPAYVRAHVSRQLFSALAFPFA